LEQTILVIEDDLDCRETICELLEFSGYRTIGFSDPVDALALLRGGLAASLILLDLFTPTMLGNEFLDDLRQEKLNTIPVVLISGDSAVREIAERLGAASFLQKPFHLRDILDCVLHYCGPGSSERSEITISGTFVIEQELEDKRSGGTG
jgi:CheY-like chemotaxis protein